MANPVKTVSIRAAKRNFSGLLALVEAGEEIVLVRGATPVAKLMPYRVSRQGRVPGSMKGVVDIGPEFFEPLPEEELRLWE